MLNIIHGMHVHHSHDVTWLPGCHVVCVSFNSQNTCQTAYYTCVIFPEPHRVVEVLSVCSEGTYTCILEVTSTRPCSDTFLWHELGVQHMKIKYDIWIYDLLGGSRGLEEPVHITPRHAL